MQLDQTWNAESKCMVQHFYINKFSKISKTRPLIEKVYRDRSCVVVWDRIAVNYVDTETESDGVVWRYHTCKLTKGFTYYENVNVD